MARAMTELREDGHAPVTVRSATVDDIDAIVTLVNQWAEHGLTLARDRASIERCLSSFTVGETDRVVACAALEIVGDGIGEVRSVSVAHDALGSGAGRLVVEGLLAKGAATGLEQVALLTKTPAFFAKLGFEAVDIAALPATYRDVGLVGRSTEGRTAMLTMLTPATVAAGPV